LQRDKETGAKQEGSLWGLQGSYGRFKRYGWYLGADASYLAGVLRGRVNDEIDLRSRFSDLLFEARVGYTFWQKEGWRCGITPFLGGGYIEERNNFTDPSPLPVHLKTTYGYGTVGFLSWVQPLCCLKVGLDCKVRMPYEPTCSVTRDPDNPSFTQRIGQKLQYRFDLPITWSINQTCRISIDPFLDYRTFGSQTNYPFDFIKTNETFLGLFIAFQLRL
jgi:hypothetical protein